MDGWSFETTFASGKPGIWMLGWDAVKPYRTDAQVSATALRHGNFDYLTNTVKWDPEIGRSRAAEFTVSASEARVLRRRTRLRLALGGSRQVTRKLHTLPAKARYDAGTPFTSLEMSGCIRQRPGPWNFGLNVEIDGSRRSIHDSNADYRWFSIEKLHKSVDSFTTVKFRNR